VWPTLVASFNFP